MNWWSILLLSVQVWEELAKETKYTGDEKLASEVKGVLLAMRSIAKSDVYKEQIRKTSREYPPSPV